MRHHLLLGDVVERVSGHEEALVAAQIEQTPHDERRVACADVIVHREQTVEGIASQHVGKAVVKAHPYIIQLVDAYREHGVIVQSRQGVGVAHGARAHVLHDEPVLDGAEGNVVLVDSGAEDLCFLQNRRQGGDERHGLAVAVEEEAVGGGGEEELPVVEEDGLDGLPAHNPGARERPEVLPVVDEDAFLAGYDDIVAYSEAAFYAVGGVHGFYLPAVVPEHHAYLVLEYGTASPRVDVPYLDAILVSCAKQRQQAVEGELVVVTVATEVS